MAFERPALLELVERIQADLVSRLSIASAPLRRSVVSILARVIAGAVHMIYGRLEFLAVQLFPDTSENNFLERHASLFGYSRTEATYATGSVTAVGINGTEIPSGLVFRRTDGVEYRTTAPGAISGGEAELEVIAVLAGELGNADTGTGVRFENPVADVDVDAVATGDITGGADAETISALRTRLLARLRAPPQGGAAGDYEVWGLEVPGVTRVWIYPQELGAGTVTVRFVRDDDVSLIPSGGEVDDVSDYLDARRPVTAAVTVLAPVAVPLDMEISIVPDTSAVRIAVEAEVTDLLRREAEPGKTLVLSQLRTAIGIASGLEDFTLASPAADVTHATGELAVLGTTDWT